VSDQTSNSSSTPTTTARRPTAVLVAVGILVATPVVALMWVSSYARETPRLWGVPFFFWYQFLWVFLAAACTYAAYRIVLATTPVRRFGQNEGRTEDRTPGGER
jgi:membrane protein implicated in regulation of membrane protease activity